MNGLLITVALMPCAASCLPASMALSSSGPQPISITSLPCRSTCALPHRISRPQPSGADNSRGPRKRCSVSPSRQRCVRGVALNRLNINASASSAHEGAMTGCAEWRHGGEISGGLVGRTVGGVLETDVREHRNDRRLRQRGHGQRQIALGDAELAEGIDNGNEPGLREASARAHHVCLGNADIDEAIRKSLLKAADAGRSLHIGGDRKDRQPGLRGTDRSFGEAGLHLVFLDARGRRCGALAFFAASFCSHSCRKAFAQFANSSGVSPLNLVDELDDFLAVREREAVAARGVFLRGLYAVALDRFHPHEARGKLGLVFACSMAFSIAR